jgi:hypothetical protein
MRVSRRFVLSIRVLDTCASGQLCTDLEVPCRALGAAFLLIPLY